jgi:predicted nucleotidyltransferase
VARGTATRDSDVDVLFVEETELPYLNRIDRYFDVLADRLDRTVEILVYTPSELDRRAELPFLKKALAEGIVVYEQGKI